MADLSVQVDYQAIRRLSSATLQDQRAAAVEYVTDYERDMVGASRTEELLGDYEQALTGQRPAPAADTAYLREVYELSRAVVEAIDAELLRRTTF